MLNGLLSSLWKKFYVNYYATTRVEHRRPSYIRWIYSILLKNTNYYLWCVINYRNGCRDIQIHMQETKMTLLNQVWKLLKYGLIFMKFPQVISVNSNHKKTYRFLDKRQSSKIQCLDKELFWALCLYSILALLFYRGMR